MLLLFLYVSTTIYISHDRKLQIKYREMEIAEELCTFILKDCM